jgi:hypothetical protein
MLKTKTRTRKVPRDKEIKPLQLVERTVTLAKAIATYW